MSSMLNNHVLWSWAAVAALGIVGAILVVAGAGESQAAGMWDSRNREAQSRWLVWIGTLLFLCGVALAVFLLVD